jgi:hypothetical protein
VRRREYEGELPGIKREKSRSSKFRRLLVLEILAVILVALTPIPLISYKHKKQEQELVNVPNIEVSAENSQSPLLTTTPKP